MMRGKLGIVAGCGFILLSAVAGCGRRDDLVCYLKAYENNVSCDTYRVDVPDSITIFAPSAPEIHNHRQVVQPDGRITLELLGEVYVAGLTPSQIADKIKLLISEYYEDVDVQVRVTDYNSKKWYTYGEMAPGSHPYTGRDTLMDALVDGSINEMRAQLTNIQIVRTSPDKNRRRVMHVNLHTMIKDGNTVRNILLQPGDVVYAPKNGFAVVTDFFQQIMMPLSPTYNMYSEPVRWRDQWADLQSDRGRD